MRRVIFYIIILLLILINNQIIYSQDGDSLTTYEYDCGQSIEYLPKKISVQKGISLYADFSAITEEAIPIYIINNSDSVFKYIDYGISLFMEHKISEQNWTRSLPYYEYYDYCVLEMLDCNIKPGCFFILNKYFPNKGEEKLIRFVLSGYNTTSSNIGRGRIDDSEFIKVKYDDISLLESSSDFLISILENGLPNRIDSSEYHRIYLQTMDNLKKHYPEKAQLYLKDSLAIRKFNSQILFFSKYLAHEYLNYSEEYFSVVEKMPEPIGGFATIQSKTIYPKLAKETGIQGKVYVRAYINENGIVDKTELIRGIGGGCDEEAIRVIEITSFKPGKERGKEVKVKVIIPVIFKK